MAFSPIIRIPRSTVLPLRSVGGVGVAIGELLERGRDGAPIAQGQRTIRAMLLHLNNLAVDEFGFRQVGTNEQLFTRRYAIFSAWPTSNRDLAAGLKIARSPDARSTSRLSFWRSITFTVSCRAKPLAAL